MSKLPLLQARVNAMSKERGQGVLIINVVLPNNAVEYPVYPNGSNNGVPIAPPLPQALALTSALRSSSETG